MVLTSVLTSWPPRIRTCLRNVHIHIPLNVFVSKHCPHTTCLLFTHHIYFTHQPTPSRESVVVYQLEKVSYPATVLLPFRTTTLLNRKKCTRSVLLIITHPSYRTHNFGYHLKRWNHANVPTYHPLFEYFIIIDFGVDCTEKNVSRYVL